MSWRTITLGPWAIGALVWGLLSLTIINEHFRVSGGSDWQEIWFLCSLIWFQFGFARLFSTLLKKQYHLLKDQLFMALLPPVVLYLFIAPSILGKKPLP
jgi:hypothetical protein